MRTPRLLHNVPDLRHATREPKEFRLRVSDSKCPDSWHTRQFAFNMNAPQTHHACSIHERRRHRRRTPQAAPQTAPRTSQLTFFLYERVVLHFVHFPVFSYHHMILILRGSMSDHAVSVPIGSVQVVVKRARSRRDHRNTMFNIIVFVCGDAKWIVQRSHAEFCDLHAELKLSGVRLGRGPPVVVFRSRCSAWWSTRTWVIIQNSRSTWTRY